MSTHSSILAPKIPWTEEPGRLQFKGSQSRTQLSMQANKAEGNKSGPGRKPAPLSAWVSGEGMALVPTAVFPPAPTPSWGICTVWCLTLLIVFQLVPFDLISPVRKFRLFEVNLPKVILQVMDRSLSLHVLPHAGKKKRY